MAEGRAEVGGSLVPVVLCADDYGLAPGVSAGIRELLDAGRLSATGAMTLSPHWAVEGPRLAAYGTRADLGLHLTLTDLAPLGAMPSLAPGGRLPALGTLIRRAYLGGLDGDEVAAELDRQIAAFAHAVGRPPDFIDGHQHVHQLPGVRQAVLARAGALGPQAYVRYAVDGVGAILARGVAVVRALAIAAMGRAMAREGARAGIPGPRVFRGVRDFTPGEDVARLMPRFLAHPVPRMVLACHPGRVDAALAALDPVLAPREAELAYLASPRFEADLAAAGARLARFHGD